MSDGGTDWEDEEESPERPFGPKPFGPKPFGPKSFGLRPFGPKPFGPKPFGPKPFGPKPFGAGDADGGFLDPEAWGADIAELVCERSAVIRLGATLISSERGRSVPVPVFEVAADFTAAGAELEPKKESEKVVEIRPGEWRLSAAVGVSPRVLGAVAAKPELAYTLKAHLAARLADRADEAFLQGAAVGLKGIARRMDPAPYGEDRLKAVRELVAEVRSGGHPFRNPGWILAPDKLNELTELLTADGWHEGGNEAARTLDSHGLLRLDGLDGGAFLGFPFLSSAAAGSTIYFAADWQEAWIGLEEYFVSVFAEPASEDRVVVRASMPLDFALRTTGGFAHLGVEAQQAQSPPK